MNKNIYYPTYTINPESIYGSGIVSVNKFPHTDTTTSVITDSFPTNKHLSPPIYRSGISKKPLDTNGYRVLKNQNDETYKLDNYYYPTQQSNKNIVPDIKPTFREKLKEKIKDVANKFVNEKTELPPKNNKTIKQKDIENMKFENLDDDTEDVMNYIRDEINPKTDTTVNSRDKKMWIDDHFLYSLEPRYNSVVYPWRAYTWMYPVTPNSDNYYIDNINSSPSDPIIVSNDNTNRLNWQGTYLKSNLLKEDFVSKLNSETDTIEKKYQENKCYQNYNILYFIIIVLILSIYFSRE
jgi:hypothetical protein